MKVPQLLLVHAFFQKRPLTFLHGGQRLFHPVHLQQDKGNVPVILCRIPCLCVPLFPGGKGLLKTARLLIAVNKNTPQLLVIRKDSKTGAAAFNGLSIVPCPFHTFRHTPVSLGGSILLFHLFHSLPESLICLHKLSVVFIDIADILQNNIPVSPVHAFQHFPVIRKGFFMLHSIAV